MEDSNNECDDENTVNTALDGAVDELLAVIDTQGDSEMSEMLEGPNMYRYNRE